MPPITTSDLQPLDLGIIKDFKVYYHKFLLQSIIAPVEECSTAVSRHVLKDDPFADLELHHKTDELQVMITQVGGITEGTCSVEEFTTADDGYLCAKTLSMTHGMQTS